jgi:hypothetical protein
MNNNNIFLGHKNSPQKSLFMKIKNHRVMNSNIILGHNKKHFKINSKQQQ